MLDITPFFIIERTCNTLTMTGSEFKKLIDDAGYSMYTLADRWDVGKSTLYDEAQKDEVRGLYADAVRTLQRDT